jgi:hypothetical protein
MSIAGFFAWRKEANRPLMRRDGSNTPLAGIAFEKGAGK